MVTEKLTPISYLRGPEGAKGVKGDTGTFAGANAVSVAAEQPAEVFLTGPETAKVANFRIPRGLPGTNALANDSAFATYIAALDSETRAALEGGFTPKGVFYVNVADVGAPMNGVDDDAAPINAAINAWSGSFGVLKLTAPPGSTIRSSGIVVSKKSVIVDFSGSHVVRTAAQPIFTGEGEWGPNISVGGVTTNSLNSVLTVADASGFAVGNMVKVFSDNVISDARDEGTGSVGRQGEFAVITAISGNTVTVVAPLLDTYDLNVRVAKFIPHHIEFHFGTADFDAASGGGAGGTFSGRVMFRLRSLPFPAVTGDILRAPGPAVYLESTYGARVDVSGANLPETDGYVVGSYSSVASDLRINANRCRHSYTDGVYPLATGETSDPGRYGRSMFDRITGASMATTQASWDTHHGGYGHLFYDISATGAGASGAPLFSLRGRSHTIANPFANGAQVGFRIHDEGVGTWATSEGHRIIGATTRNVRQPIQIALSQIMDVRRGFTVSIDGGDFDATGAACMDIANGRVLLNGCPTFRYTGLTVPSTSNLINVGNGEVRGSARIVARSITSGTLTEIISFGTLSSGFQTVDLDLDLVLSDWALLNTTCVIRWATARGEVRAKVNDATTMLPQAGNTQRAPLQVATLRALRTNDAASSSAFRALTVTAGANLTHWSGDPVILYRVRATSAATAGEVYAGAFAGQQMVIYCHTGSPAAVTIPHGASFGTDLGGANVTLSPGQSMRLMWDGTSGIWARVA
ncbi:hypothetical protein [Microbacterium gilvum]|uniref:Depolymerase 2 capsule K5-specific C-terminal domain-containing protein n=1 Tax=Microbacterium gilvum TaxID=1336204 RepID=A0ABP9A6D5_9MICO